MTESKKATAKVLTFAPRPSSTDGKLEKWFRGVIQSNHDLVAALERLSDSYRSKIGPKPPTESDQAVLLAVQITLNNARNARNL